MLPHTFIIALFLKKKRGFLIKPRSLVFSMVLLCLINSLFFSNTIYAQKISHEDKIKASFVFNFIRFIQWPEYKLIKSSDPINVCVIDFNRSNNSFFKAFHSFFLERYLAALQSISNQKNINYCHLIYIDQAETNNLDTLLPLISKNHILSISNIKNFCAAGGIIGMVKRKGKIRVEINLQAARASGFTISSNLLEVATIIVNKP